MQLNRIDLHNFDFNAPDGRNEATAIIDEAFRNTGFLLARNIGIPAPLLDEVFTLSKAFFDLPEPEKLNYKYTGPMANFGYQPLMTESLAPGTPPDLKEAFTMRNARERADDASIWPAGALREASRALFNSCFDSANAILKLCAMALGEDEGALSRCHSGKQSTLRLLHYPADTPAPDASQMGAGAHTDYGAITLLFQQNVGGLQIKDKNGQWDDCKGSSGDVIINVGDMLERWSNGIYTSSEHRVLPKSGDARRFSIAFFMDPDDEALISPFEQGVREVGDERYAPILAGDYITQRIADSQSATTADP